MNKLAMLLLLAASGAWAQAVGGGGVPGSGGGAGGAPGGSTTQAQFNNAGSFAGASGLTFNSAGAVTKLANSIYLSCASELGAQINAAVTALGSAGGQIFIPCTTATITTTAANIPHNVAIHGYGKDITIITCTVAGDCLQLYMNPTTVGESGSEIDGFTLEGNGASNQVLMHGNGTSGYTMHDISLFYPGTGGVCLEFDNSATGLFSERNRTYNFILTGCATGLLFNQSGSDSSTSFAYNTFEFGISTPTGANWGVVFQGNSQLYGGTLDITANYDGTNGGIIDFVGNVNASGGGLQQAERLFISVENNSGQAGTILNVPSTGSSLSFDSVIINGAGGSPSMATVSSVATGSYLYLSSVNGTQGTTGGFNTSMANDYNYGTSSGGAARAFWCPNLGQCSFLVGQNYSHFGQILFGEGPDQYQFLVNGTNYFQITPTGTVTTGALGFLGGSHTWSFNSSGATSYLYDSTAATTPLAFTSAGSPYNNQVYVSAQAVLGWSSVAQYANNASPDTGFSRTAANAVACGNGTQGNATCALTVGKLNVLPARKGTFVCTAAGTITIANTNELVTSDVVISLNTAGGTITTAPAMKTTTSGTGFTVLCGATDTSTYNYDILN